MDGNIQTGIPLKLVQGIGNLLHRFILAGKRHAQGGHYTDGIFIAAFDDLFNRHNQTVPFHGDLPKFYIPVASEFVPADLHRTADHIWLIRWLTLGTHLLPPSPFHGQPTQHGSLAGTGGGASHSVGGLRRIPQTR